MSQLIAFLQTHATLTNILLVGGTLVSILTVVGNALKALAPAGSKAAHFADLCLALAIDVQKAAQAVQRLFGSSSVAAVAKGLVLVPLLVLGLSRPAHAESMAALGPAPAFHFGPSVSLYELRLDGQVGQLTPGLGVQGWIGFKSGGEIGLALFGSALGLGTAHPGAALSLAPFVCFQQTGFCLGPGFDLASLHDGVSGLTQGFTWKKNFFVVAQVLPKFWELLHVHG